MAKTEEIIEHKTEENIDIAKILQLMEKQQQQLDNLTKENVVLKKSIAQDDVDLEIENEYEDGELVEIKFNANTLYDTRCEKLKKHHDKLAKSYFNKGQLQNIEILQNTFNAQYMRSATQGEVVKVPSWFVKNNSRFVYKYINDPTKTSRGEPVSFITSDSQVYIGIDANNKPIEKKPLNSGIEKVPLFEIIS